MMICFEIAMFTYMPTKKTKIESEKKTAERQKTKK